MNKLHKKLKGSYGFDIMGLMFPMYMNFEEREEIVRKYANL